MIVTGTGQTRIANGQTTIGRFAAGIPAKEWALMSIPYQPDNLFEWYNFFPTLEAERQKYLNCRRQLQRYYSSSTPYQLTKAFWLKTVVKNSAYHLNFGAEILSQIQIFHINSCRMVVVVLFLSAGCVGRR